jgi:uncharacterized membrane protein
MPHQHHDLFENRNQFQLERLILFSDAVFAIAITLLVIEIRVPQIHAESASERLSELKEALWERFPEFLGFVLSFLVIGQFWLSHHRLFGYVNNYNGGLLWLNLHMLFWIILVPFSSAMNSHQGDLNAVWMWYSFNMFMIGFSLYLLWRYIGNPKHKLSYLADDKRLRKMSSTRSLTIAFIFLSGLLLCIPDWKPFSIAARGVYALIFPAMLIVNRIYRVKK